MKIGLPMWGNLVKILVNNMFSTIGGWKCGKVCMLMEVGNVWYRLRACGLRKHVEIITPPYQLL